MGLTPSLLCLFKVSKLFSSSCTIAITAFISPYKADRDVARKIHQDAGLPFIEVRSYRDSQCPPHLDPDQRNDDDAGLRGRLSGVR